MGRLLRVSSVPASDDVKGGLHFPVEDRRIPPITVVSTFTIVNIIKLPFYFVIGQFPVSTLSLSLVLLPFAAVGMILGVFLHRMVPQRPFFVLMEGALFVTASKLVWDGSRGLMGLA